ncbi:MAG TPA: SgcJ/EcaC family oxidoreductase [Rhizomicrobium sp.]|jgi:uncharacterized protein (TIGR02246 family)
MDDDIRAVREVLDRFVEAWNSRSPQGFAELYTDPHVDINHSPAVETRAATVAALRERFEHSLESLSVTSDQVLVLGDWAVQRGHIEVSGKDGKRLLCYMELLRREQDGQWRVHWGIDAPLR